MSRLKWQPPRCSNRPAATGSQHPLVDVYLALSFFAFCLQALSSAAPEVAAAAHKALARCEAMLHPRAASHAPASQPLSASLGHNLEQVGNVTRCLAGESLVRVWPQGLMLAHKQAVRSDAFAMSTSDFHRLERYITMCRACGRLATCMGAG